MVLKHTKSSLLACANGGRKWARLARPRINTHACVDKACTMRSAAYGVGVSQNQQKPLSMNTEITVSSATLYDYKTGEAIRSATAAELAASIKAAKTDGGAGVIVVDGRSCYAQE